MQQLQGLMPDYLHGGAAADKPMVKEKLALLGVRLRTTEGEGKPMLKTVIVMLLAITAGTIGDILLTKNEGRRYFRHEPERYAAPAGR
jgi:hypothetical protein